MGRPTNQTGKITMEYLRKYPTKPSLTLAKIIYKENSKHFTNIDSVRTSIRQYRGKLGKKGVKSTNEFKNQKIEFELPESHALTYEPYLISQSKILILSDLHFPYQDNEAIRAALKFGKEKKINCI